MEDKKQNSQQSENNNESEALQKKQKPEVLDIWQVLAERKRRGLFQGEIDVVQTKEFNLTRGAHYFVVADNRGRDIKCISCPISHGCILDARNLTKYKIEDGVIFYNGKALNKRAERPNE